METVLYVLAAMPVVLAALIGLGAGYGALSLGRSMRRFALRPCPSCGVPFGMASVEDGRRRHAEHNARVQKENPWLRFRFIPRWQLMCAKCGRSFVLDPLAGTLSSAEESPRRPAA